MRTKHKDYISLIIGIAGLLFISWLIGSITKTDLSTWYSTLNRSPLTPPNYVFPIAWTILYVMIATCGWTMWRQKPSPQLRRIKSLYVMQLILNWIWTPLFFRYHLTGASLMCLAVMDIAVAMIILFSYPRLRLVSLLMAPYWGWILFATYLNFYIWLYN